MQKVIIFHKFTDFNERFCDDKTTGVITKERLKKFRNLQNSKSVIKNRKDVMLQTKIEIGGHK